MFGFAVILLFLCSITFFLGANMLKVCYSVAEDPPNDLPSYELYSRVNDDVYICVCMCECAYVCGCGMDK